MISGADVFLGVSAPNIIDQKDVKNMSNDPIVFAMSNPDPEISPEEASPLQQSWLQAAAIIQIKSIMCFVSQEYFVAHWTAVRTQLMKK